MTPEQEEAITTFEEILRQRDMNELKALSARSLEHYPTDAEYNRMMALKAKLFG